MNMRKTGAVLCIAICMSGCALNQVTHDKTAISAKKTDKMFGAEEAYKSNNLQEYTNGHFASVDASTQDENQRLLDAAIEFYQIAQDAWEEGDFESALNSLDESYSLILKVDGEQDSTIMQQKEDLRFTISKRIMEVYASRFSVVAGNQKAIPLTMNEHVEQALKLFKGREKKFFLNAYVRSGRYRPAIVEALRDEGLPEELSWLPLIESGYNTRALSRARALGMWQFIASTGYKFGLERNAWIDERMDPEKSTRAAIAYLKELHGIFGDWTTALAAYNCGEGNVLKVIKRQRIKYLDNFWDLYASLPRETAFYVPKFMAVLHIINDPGAHGFTLPEVEKPVSSDKITVSKQMDLKKVAHSIGISHQEMKNLNPELRKDVTPTTRYDLKVPSGMGEVLVAQLPAIPVWAPPTPSYVVHRVRKGESLSVIAAHYGTSVRAIMNMNGLKRSSYIKQGWNLKVPTGKRTYRARFSSDGSSVEYVVRKGDSLWKIANRFGTTTKALQSFNHMQTTRLDIGQVIRIP